ncbi:MAG: Maf family protein [Rhodospirillum sp.]|nr:Maf family protein [Rhodospirillum sp.]MCF8491640.1 Maf family protein [Rhodospirillum sp.]MCF8500119.1 Maf family protein [Rhodospirillum sp.]
MEKSRPGPAVLLASGSVHRARLLIDAGIPFTAESPHVDEDTIKHSLKAEGASAIDAAIILAEFKARRLSQANPDALVIGSDQIPDLEGTWLGKPDSLAAAREQLMMMRGKTHVLETAVVVLRGGDRIWHHVARPRLTVRDFSDGFLNRYLEDAGSGILSCAGSYQVEGLGIQLFSRIEGDTFAIQGLPLLPLVDFLRLHGVLIP